MKLVDKLVLKDLLPWLFNGIALFASVYYAGGPLLEAGRLMSQGIPFRIVIQIMGLSIPIVLGLTFPMGMLLAVLMGYGRLSGESEAVALYAAGVPFSRIAAPAAVLGLIATFFGFLLNDVVALEAVKRSVDLRAVALHQIDDLNKPITLDSDVNGNPVTIHIHKGFDVRTKTVRQLTITFYDHNGAVTSVYHAVSARPEGGIDSKSWWLYKADFVKLGENPSFGRSDVIHNYEISSILDKNQERFDLKTFADTHNFFQLHEKVGELIKSGQGNNEDVRKAEISLWSKLALPGACFVFALIGAPLGLRPQRISKMSGWPPAILIIFGYYVVYTVMSSVAQGGGCPPALAVFLPDIICLVIGLYLMRRASLS
ncbi:MAG: putative permease [Capsulimonas sp.]|jgi:lipopolysaccharide export system permease protein|nr:putative permease [Capsulimonas sp.]